MNTINQELSFRSTEIGFKRLLKTNHNNKRVSQNLQQVTQIPTQGNLLLLLEIPPLYQLQDLIIHVQDPWGTNMQRASLLIGIVKKWNEFHSKLKSLLTSKSLHNVSLTKYIKTLGDYE